MRNVDVMGDEYTCDYAIALCSVTTTDFITSKVTMLLSAIITTAVNKIVNTKTHRLRAV